MVRRWHADPFGFLRPLERGARAHWKCAPPRPLDRHRGGHLPHGVASNGLLWRAIPLRMLWPEMDAAFVTSVGGSAGGPAAARRPVVITAGS